METVVPDYRERRMGMADARAICRTVGARLCPVRMVGSSAAVPPPLFGSRRLFVSDRLASASMTCVVLHELAHIAAGDAEELTYVVLDETRYPVEDRIADVVATIGITTPEERKWPQPALASRLRELCPIHGRAWRVYRSEDVASMIREPHREE